MCCGLEIGEAHNTNYRYLCKPYFLTEYIIWRSWEQNRDLWIFCIFFSRCKAMRMAGSMQSSAQLIALGATVRGTVAWGKPETTSSSVLTLTSWILWQPGRSVADFTSRQSCVAPACCSTLRTSLLAQVCQKETIQSIQMLYELIMFFYTINAYTSWSRKFSNPQTYWLAFVWNISIQMSLQHGHTCAISFQHCNTCTLMVLCISTWSLPMSLLLTLAASSWGTLGCFLSSNRRVQSL